MANKSKSIDKNKLEAYCWELYLERKDIEIQIFQESNDQDFYHYDADNNKIVLNDEFYLCETFYKYIEYVSEKLLLLSLKEENLKLIDVNREDLKFITYTRNREKTISIATLSADSAIKKARQWLEEDGYKDIKIGTAYPATVLGDKGYNVSTWYVEEKQELDIDDIYNKNFIKKLK